MPSGGDVWCALSTIGQETGNELHVGLTCTSKLALVLYTRHSRLNESVRQVHTFALIIISELDSVSGVMTANPWIIGSTVEYARKEAYFSGKMMQMYLQLVKVIIPEWVEVVQCTCNMYAYL